MTTASLQLHNPALPGEQGSRRRVPHSKADEMRAAAMNLFLALDLFFVKVSDFMFIVPKFPHLRNVQMQVQYREIPPDPSWLDKLTFPPKWRQDHDADSNFGFAPGAKTYVNGELVHEDKPKMALTSKTPFPEQRVPRLGLRQIFPNDPEYSRLCIEQGLEHLLLERGGDHQLVNGNVHTPLVNGAIMGITPPESTNGEFQILRDRDRTSADAALSGLGLTLVPASELPNGVSENVSENVNINANVNVNGVS